VVDTGRFLLAIVLMIAVMVITNLLFPPVRPPAEPPLAPDVPVERPDRALPDPDVPTIVPVDPPPPPPPEAAAAEEVAVAPADTIFVESGLYRYGFSTRGAALVGAELLRFESHATPGASVDLAAADPRGFVSHRVRLGQGGPVIDLAETSFRVEPPDTRLNVAAGPAMLRFVHDDPRGFRVELDYTFTPDDYLIGVRGRVIGIQGTTPQLLVDMGPTLPSHEANPVEDERALAYVLNHERTGIATARLRAVRGERVDEGPLYWVAIKNKYFVAAVLRAGVGAMPFGGVIAREAPAEHAAYLSATLLPSPDGDFSYRLYIGPQEAVRLTAIGDSFQDVNPYGWRVFRPVLRPLGHAITWLLVRMHTALDLGYGWVLILFGVLIRVLLWPLNAKAMRSQLRNMEIQPRMKEIQTKYKNNPEQLQKEMLKLYKEEGFNPFGGCLPLLIPFPLLIALFFVFQSTIEFRGVEFLWLPDLSRADPLYILPVLLGASMFLLQWISMRTATEVPAQMKFMMYFMPLFMVIIFLNLASGLNLYYASMNFASLPQQLLIMRERKRHMEKKGRIEAKAKR
jgi:YidC/Oxa1 family membrane protein insertase